MCAEMAKDGWKEGETANYKMTGVTGSFLYMAPEVVRCEAYNEKVRPPPPPPFLPAWPCRCAFHRNLASVMACFVSDVTLALDNRCKACIVPCGALVRASCCVRLAVGSPAGSRAEWQTRATRCRSLDDACRCS